MDSLLILAVLVYLVWQWVDRTVPLATRLPASVVRLFWRWLWKNPVRRCGVLMTLWWWLLGLAVLFTLAGLAAIARGDGATIFTALLLWGLVVLGWRFLRWRARRRYTPRQLPRRQQEEQRWQ